MMTRGTDTKKIDIYLYNDEFFDEATLYDLLFDKELKQRSVETGRSWPYIKSDRFERELINETVRKTMSKLPSVKGYEGGLKLAKKDKLSRAILLRKFAEAERARSETSTTISTEDSKERADTHSKDELAFEAASYKNCYHLINHDAEDFIGTLLNKKNDSSTVAEHLAGKAKYTVEKCKQIIAKISPASYDEKARRNFVIFNYRLSCLGVAPRWRGIQRDSFFKVGGHEITPQQKAFMRDVQVFDMEWIHRRYRGHQVNTTWDGVMEGIFTSDQFDTKKAAIIAEMEIKPSKKCDYLMLNAHMQRELHMLRTKETDTFMASLMEKSLSVENDLRYCAQRNRYRGKKLLQNLEVRVNLWIATTLSESGPLSVIMDNYKIMTGRCLTKANCQRILNTLNDALAEVGSKHVLNLS